MELATTQHGCSSIRGVVGWLMIAVLAVGGLTVNPRPALAQQDEIDTLVDEASNHYDQLEIEPALQKLQQAVQLAENKGLSGPSVSRAYVMVGVVQYGASKNKDAALKAFKEALRADPGAEVPSVYETPTLEKVMEQARESLDVSKPDETTPQEADDDAGPRRDVDSFTHDPITSAQAGDSLVIETFIPTDMSIGYVYFYFQRYDQDEWTKLTLEATNATRFATEIPGYKVYTSEIDYYLEAVDPSGEVIATSGDERDPHEITILGSASFDPEQAKKEAMEKKRREEEQQQSDDDSSSDDSGGGLFGGGDDSSDDSSGGDSSDDGTRDGYVEFGGGTGVGFVPKHQPRDNAPPPTENPQRALNPGLAPAFAHLMFGGGIWLDDTSSLGLYLRWQLAPSADLERGRIDLGAIEGNDPYSGFTGGECLGTGLHGDCQLGVKYRWYFPSGPDLELFSSVGGGVGRVRQHVRLKEQEGQPYCSDKTTYAGEGAEPDYCYRPDTVRPGWLHVGIGGGFAYQFNDTFSMIGEAYLEILFPDPSVNLDVNFGPQFRF